MSLFLSPFYEILQNLKSLESDLAQRRWVKRFCPKAIKAKSAQELDHIYQTALAGQEAEAIQALSHWLEFRHRHLSRLAERPFFKRLIPWRMLQELKRLRKRALELRSKLTPPPSFNLPRAEATHLRGRKLGILKTSWRPLLEDQMSVSAMLSRHPSSDFPSVVIDSEQLSESLEAIEALLVPNTPLPSEVLAGLAHLKSQGLRLYRDDSVSWIPGSELDAHVSEPPPPVSWFDAICGATIDRIVPSPHLNGPPVYHTPPSYPIPLASFQVAEAREEDLAMLLMVTSVQDLEKLLHEYQDIFLQFPQAQHLMLRPPSMSLAEDWEELLSVGRKQLPDLVALEFLPTFALPQVKHFTFLPRLNRSMDKRLGCALLHACLSQASHVFVPTGFPLAACENDAHALRFDTPSSLKERLNTWLTSSETRRHLAYFWRQYALATQDLWLNVQRAHLALESMSMEKSHASVRQVLDLTLAAWKSRMPVHQSYQVIQRYQNKDVSPEISVIITNFNYEVFILETLEALRAQSFTAFEILIVDDRSTDDSLQTIAAWMAEHHSHFAGITLILNDQNSGPSVGRNHGILEARAPLLFIQDADNPIEPGCLAQLHAALPIDAPYAFAYPTLQTFGLHEKRLSDVPWNPLSLIPHNRIDTMALIRASALTISASYRNERKGWEDYDLWCQFASLGLLGHHVEQVLARYRAHASNISHAHTRQPEVQLKMRHLMRESHPWIRL